MAQFSYKLKARDELIHLRDEKSVHVLLQLSVDVRASHFFECSAVENHDVTLLARVGVDNS